MELLQSTEDKIPSVGGHNPFAALTRLNNAIMAIDRFLVSPTRGIINVLTHRRLAYLRNTLAVSYDLWQSDVHARVNRSRQGFYIFCMTDREKQAFQRRMIPCFKFSAEEMCSLAIEQLAHITDLIESCANDAKDYVNHNKDVIRVGLNADDDQIWRVFKPLRLPEIKDSNI